MINYTKTFAGTQSSYDEGLRSYMLKIYNYMATALVITGIAAYATINVTPIRNLMFQVSSDGQLIGTTGINIVVTFAPIAIAIYLLSSFNRISIEGAKGLFWTYAVLMGMSLSSLSLMYTGESIARTFFIAASTFGAMSLYGYNTNRDLTSFRSFLVMGVIGLFIASLVNMFLQSSALNFATSLIGIGVFMGLIAWDTQNLKAIYYSSGGGEYGQKMSIMGALKLYVNFINLFLSMLRFFGNRRD